MLSTHHQSLDVDKYRRETLVTQHVKDGSLVCVFFSGYGLEHKNVSYLLPLGMPADFSREDCDDEAVSLDWIMICLR